MIKKIWRRGDVRKNVLNCIFVSRSWTDYRSEINSVVSFGDTVKEEPWWVDGRDGFGREGVGGYRF